MKREEVAVGPTEQVPPEDGDRIQSPKRRVLKNRKIDNVRNCDSYINIPSSETYR
jgi:hypothetical protein